MNSVVDSESAKANGVRSGFCILQVGDLAVHDMAFSDIEDLLKSQDLPVKVTFKPIRVDARRAELRHGDAVATNDEVFTEIYKHTVDGLGTLRGEETIKKIWGNKTFIVSDLADDEFWTTLRDKSKNKTNYLDKRIALVGVREIGKKIGQWE